MAGTGQDQYYQYQSGLGSVSSYQVSGIPYVTSSTAPGNTGTPLHLAFDRVTKFVVVKNIGSADMRIGYSAAGVSGSNYFLLKQNESLQAEVRVTDLYILGHSASAVTASVAAGLTGIAALNLPNNWSGSLGVG
jgi:hypothetical protein